MVYPAFFGETFWNYSEVCKLVGARYTAAPLGLITVAAMLPQSWDVRLINRNTEDLSEADVAWADVGHDRRHAAPAGRHACDRQVGA